MAKLNLDHNEIAEVVEVVAKNNGIVDRYEISWLVVLVIMHLDEYEGSVNDVVVAAITQDLISEGDI